MRRTIIAGLALVLSAALRGANVDADVMERGRQHFLAACAACHSPDQGGKVGPDLRGVAGRKAGKLAGFTFSRAMKTSPIIWDAKLLDAFTENPQAVVPRNAMPYPGLPDAITRAELVAYLLVLK